MIVLSVTRLCSAQNPSFDAGIAFGNVNTYNIWEASGIIASRQNPGVLWTHNDSGFPGSVFALSTNGMLLSHWAMPDVYFGDFEDISFGPGPNPAYDYIYLGDIGDNFLTRSSIILYRFPEPSAYGYQSNLVVEGSIPKWEAITLTYPDGVYNAEGMLIDPRTGDLFIFTKLDNSSRVYRATRAQLDSGEPVTLTFMVEISFRKISGADISRDGSLIAVRRGGNAALWKRSRTETVDQAIAATPIAIPVAVEPNGEAIGFAPDADAYFTLSEQYLQPIYYYARTDTTPPHPRLFVPPGATWLYDDSGFGNTDDWMTPTFGDGFFSSGAAPLGYGSSEATTISYGFPDDKVITTYFRNHFNVPSVAGLTNLALRLCFNDGVAVYLNGTEIARRNLPRGAQYDTLATTTNTDLRNFWISVPVAPSLVHTGQNIIAVELHRADHDGAALNFDLQLAEAFVDQPARITTLPRILNGQCSIHIKGPAGSSVHVLSSTNLLSWGLAGTVLLVNGDGDFQEPAGTALKFYKLAD